MTATKELLRFIGKMAHLPLTQRPLLVIERTVQLLTHKQAFTATSHINHVDVLPDAIHVWHHSRTKCLLLPTCKHLFFCLLAARCSFLTNAYGLKVAGGKTRTAACTALPEDLIWIKREMKSCANLCPWGKKKNQKKKNLANLWIDCRVMRYDWLK